MKLDSLLLDLYGTTTGEKFKLPNLNKKLPKGTKVSIIENLKAHRLAKLKKAKEKFGFKDVQYNDGTMIYKGYDENKTKIYFD